jgi:hypothetical protein
MNEALVEWTLLREQSYLKKCLGLDLKRKLFQQYSTEYGRIDFAHELPGERILITELETVVDQRSKLDYCQKQTLEYRNIRFNKPEKPLIAILAADETPLTYKQALHEFAGVNEILLRFYSLAVVQQHYQRLLEEAIKTSGAPISRPVANNFTHLAALNRFILPFYEKSTDQLRRESFAEYFGLRAGVADSHFKVHKQMAEYFELIIDTSKGTALSSFRLTNSYGVRFRDSLNYEFILQNKKKTSTSIKQISLSVEQRRILIESLMNGNISERKGKANILYFLRLLHITEGLWIPRGRDLDKEHVDFVNAFLGTNYRPGVLANWLSFICNHCEELSLVEHVRTSTKYDRAILTTLGSRVLGFIEMDLHLKREKLQIPLQI